VLNLSPLKIPKLGSYATLTDFVSVKGNHVNLSSRGDHIGVTPAKILLAVKRETLEISLESISTLHLYILLQRGSRFGTLSWDPQIGTEFRSTTTPYLAMSALNLSMSALNLSFAFWIAAAFFSSFVRLVAISLWVLVVLARAFAVSIRRCFAESSEGVELVSSLAGSRKAVQYEA
jgi:hypothetical protein